jgi:hypothetical protein
MARRTSPADLLKELRDRDKFEASEAEKRQENKARSERIAADAADWKKEKGASHYELFGDSMRGGAGEARTNLIERKAGELGISPHELMGDADPHWKGNSQVELAAMRAGSGGDTLDGAFSSLGNSPQTSGISPSQLERGMPAPAMPEGGNQPTITERRRDSLSDPNRMTAMDQRRIVASEQGADRRTYQLLRRAYQGHARAGRGRRGDPDANLRALGVFEAANAMGMNLSQAYQQGPREGQVRANLTAMSQATDAQQARAIRRQQNFFDRR